MSKCSIARTLAPVLIDLVSLSRLISEENGHKPFFLEREEISLSQYFEATGRSLFFLLKVGISYKLKVTYSLRSQSRRCFKLNTKWNCHVVPVITLHIYFISSRQHKRKKVYIAYNKTAGTVLQPCNCDLNGQ